MISDRIGSIQSPGANPKLYHVPCEMMVFNSDNSQYYLELDLVSNYRGAPIRRASCSHGQIYVEISENLRLNTLMSL